MKWAAVYWLVSAVECPVKSVYQPVIDGEVSEFLMNVSKVDLLLDKESPEVHFRLPAM